MPSTVGGRGRRRNPGHHPVTSHPHVPRRSRLCHRITTGDPPRGHSFGRTIRHRTHSNHTGGEMTTETGRNSIGNKRNTHYRVTSIARRNSASQRNTCPGIHPSLSHPYPEVTISTPSHRRPAAASFRPYSGCPDRPHSSPCGKGTSGAAAPPRGTPERDRRPCAPAAAGRPGCTGHVSPLRHLSRYRRPDRPPRFDSVPLPA